MVDGWKTYKLSDIADIGSSKRIFRSDYVEKGIPFFRSKEIIQKSFGEEISDMLFISPEKFRIIKEKYGAPSFRDILISSVGNRSGIPYLVKKEPEFYFKDGNLIWFRNFKSSVYSPFLVQWLKSRIGQGILKSTMIGSAQKALTIEGIRNIELALPKIDEQKAIANLLSTLDDKIALNLQMNKTLEKMAMALFKYWFVDSNKEKAAVLSDYIYLNPRLSIKKGSIASYVNMKSLPTTGMSVSNVEKIVVKGGAKFQNNDTLFARITPCLQNGKTAFVDFLEENEIGFGSTEFLVLRAKEGVSKYWAYCLSRDKNFINHAVSTMVGTSGRQRVQNEPFLKLPLPPIDTKRMSLFDSRVDAYFKKVKTNIDENRILTKLRDTLLPKLISGETRVKDAAKLITQHL